MFIDIKAISLVRTDFFTLLSLWIYMNVEYLYS